MTTKVEHFSSILKVTCRYTGVEFRLELPKIIVWCIFVMTTHQCLSPDHESTLY